jgi:hypothetical protein
MAAAERRKCLTVVDSLQTSTVAQRNTTHPRSKSMRVVNRLFGLVAASVLVAGAADAQSCMGFPSFGSAGKNVSAQAYLPDGATTVLGQLNMGKDGGHFAGINAGFTTIDGADETPITVGGLFGVQRSTGKINWCPVGDLSYRTESKDINAGLSLAASFEAMTGGAFSLSPFGSVGVNYWKPDGFDADGWLRYGVGVAFRLTNGIVIAPSLDFTSVEDSKERLGLRISIPLGGM